MIWLKSNTQSVKTIFEKLHLFMGLSEEPIRTPYKFLPSNEILEKL